MNMMLIQLRSTVYFQQFGNSNRKEDKDRVKDRGFPSGGQCLSSLS